MIVDGVNGYTSDLVGVLHTRIKKLLKDHEAAMAMSAECRKSAINYFGRT